MLRIPALQTTSGTLLGSMCTVDPSVVNYLKEVGCLQLIEQIHQANMQRRKQQEQRQRHLQQQQVSKQISKQNSEIASTKFLCCCFCDNEAIL